MKCPYRKLTSFSRDVYVSHDSAGNHCPHTENVRCAKDDAEYIAEDFMECLGVECSCYSSNDKKCLKQV